jgi:hypothetical protein
VNDELDRIWKEVVVDEFEGNILVDKRHGHYPSSDDD